MRRKALIVLALLGILYALASLIGYNTISIGHRTFASTIPDEPFFDLAFPSWGQNYQVHAFFMPGKPGYPALISVHGYNMSRHSEYHLRRANDLRKLGYTVLSIDLHDNGGDTVRNGRISLGYGEMNDVLGAFHYLLSIGYSPDRIGVVSESMGASASLMAAGQEPRIRAIWADSPFEDATTAVQERITRAHLPGFLAYGILLWGQLIGGDRIWIVRPIELGERFARNKQAVYLVASTTDQDVLFHHSADLDTAYKASGVDVEFWEVSGLAHVETIIYRHDVYFSRLDAFFRHHLVVPG